MRLLAVTLPFVLPVLLAAQDAAALAADEGKLVARAVPGLHALADALQAQRQHLRALALRCEIWQDYATDDAKARTACGFVRVGDLWRIDANALVLDRDLKADAKGMRKVEQDLDALGRELLTAHRGLAVGYGKIGDSDRAQHHWQRVLRWAPGDAEAQQQLALQPFEGYRGTPDEVAMLQRARAIGGACDWLRRAEFRVVPLENVQLPLLAEAKIVHAGVRSRHFEIWGTLPLTELTTIAQDCERGLLLTRALFGTWLGAPLQRKKHLDLVFLHDSAAYGALLDSCAAQFDPERLRFLKQDVDQAFVAHGTREFRVHKAHLGLEASRDQAVRGVVQDAVGVMTDGLYEGMGHAACGFLFGRTLTFLLEQQRDLTAATWKQRALVPDLAVWMQIAAESAWAKSDTRTSELVLLSAARFSTEQRVKAWAICHYLLHWRPDLLPVLDTTRSEKVRTPPDVEAEFLRRTKVELPRIDSQWREFWGKGQELRAAMALDPLPPEKAKDRPAKLRARGLVDAVNAARAAADRGPAGWFVAAGPDVLAVTRHDEALAKAAADRRKQPKSPVVDPEPPACLGSTVLWSRAETPAAAVAWWLADPASRDRLLHPGRELFGASTFERAWVLDVGATARPTRVGPPLAWPSDRQLGVPGSVRVEALGKRALAALAAAGKKPGDDVGPALSLHFARVVADDLLAKVECRVWVGNDLQPGVLVRYAGAAGATGDAEGCVAFVPLAPLPAGAIEVHWHLPAELLPPETTFPKLTFLVG